MNYIIYVLQIPYHDYLRLYVLLDIAGELKSKSPSDSIWWALFRIWCL